MNMHELLRTAVEDLPDAPDQLPGVERAARRRTVMHRVGAVAATSVLVLGVGTVSIVAPWSRRAAPASAPAAHSPLAVVDPDGDFPQQAVRLLQPACAGRGAEGQLESLDFQARLGLALRGRGR